GIGLGVGKIAMEEEDEGLGHGRLRLVMAGPCRARINYSNRLLIRCTICSLNLRALDLNLLVVLDALLDEAHVSRAADRLGLSQPATSAALQRCRHLFGDELLQRGRGTMSRT